MSCHGWRLLSVMSLGSNNISTLIKQPWMLLDGILCVLPLLWEGMLSYRRYALIGESISKVGGVSFICGVEVMRMKVFVKQE